MTNSITDIKGLSVGHAQDEALASGVTVVVFDPPVPCSVDVRGGGPCLTDAHLLEPERTVQEVDAICLSGGSVYGLEAAGGVRAALARQGRGFAVGPVHVPIVPGACLFDLLNGGNKSWGRFPPYRELGERAVQALKTRDIALGTVGAGYGATTANLKGGLGTASALSPSGHWVAAIAAVNAVGSVTIGETGHFWAASDEKGSEFGGLGYPHPFPPLPATPKLKGAAPRANTTIALVVTDAKLTKAECKQLAIMAQDGLARAIRPAHLPLDGDTVFAAATGAEALTSPLDMSLIGHTAASVLARACARGVYEATALHFEGAVPGWKERFGEIK